MRCDSTLVSAPAHARPKQTDLAPSACSISNTRRCRTRESLSSSGTKQHSTYRSRSEIVEYPWHPLHGRHLTVYRQVGNRGGGVVHVKAPDGFSCELPQWMFDRALCRVMDQGAPQVCVAALEELREVLSLISSQRAENARSDDDDKHGDFNEPTSEKPEGTARSISQLAAISSGSTADTSSHDTSTGGLAHRGARRQHDR